MGNGVSDSLGDDKMFTADEVKNILGEENFDQGKFDATAIMGIISGAQLKALIYEVTDANSETKHNALQKPADKRSAMVDRKRGPKQVLCYICCAEFGTNSLAIHQKTCIKKHTWGLQNVLDDEAVSRKQAAINRKKCVEPGTGPELPIPGPKASAAEIDAYDAAALAVFVEHSTNCLWCRTLNIEAIEAARRAEEEAARKRMKDADAAEAARRKAEQDAAEAARRKAEEEEADRLRKKMEAEDEARRIADEEERARRLKKLAEEEEEAKRKAAAAAEEEERRKRAQEEEAARRRAQREAEEAARRKAELEAAEKAALERERRQMEIEDEMMRRLVYEEEEAARKRKLRVGQHKFLKKGEGTTTAMISGKVHQDAELEAQARHDIAYNSLAHAKKAGLVHATVEKKEEKPVIVEVELDNTMDVNWQKNWTPDQEAEFAKKVAAERKSDGAS